MKFSRSKTLITIFQDRITFTGSGAFYNSLFFVDQTSGIVYVMGDVLNEASKSTSYTVRLVFIVILQCSALNIVFTKIISFHCFIKCFNLKKTYIILILLQPNKYLNFLFFTIYYILQFLCNYSFIVHKSKRKIK